MPLWMNILFCIVGVLIAVPIVNHFWPKQGKWAINADPLICSVCRASGPRVRLPRTKQQFLWGGWTCENCGTELDKFGQPVEESE